MTTDNCYTALLANLLTYTTDYKNRIINIKNQKQLNDAVNNAQTNLNNYHSDLNNLKSIIFTRFQSIISQVRPMYWTGVQNANFPTGGIDGYFNLVQQLQTDIQNTSFLVLDKSSTQFKNLITALDPMKVIPANLQNNNYYTNNIVYPNGNGVWAVSSCNYNLNGLFCTTTNNATVSACCGSRDFHFPDKALNCNNLSGCGGYNQDAYVKYNSIVADLNSNPQWVNTVGISTFKSYFDGLFPNSSDITTFIYYDQSFKNKLTTATSNINNFKPVPDTNKININCCQSITFANVSAKNIGIDNVNNTCKITYNDGTAKVIPNS